MKAILLAAALVALARAATPPSAPAPDAGSRPGGVTTRYDDYFRKYSKRYFGVGFDWRLFKAQAIIESGLLPNAHSEAGARGIMQLMPSTYAQIASARTDYQAIDDPQWNIAAGILHDRYLWSFWGERSAADDRHRFMFGSYNAGEVTISRAQAAARKAELDPALWPSVEVVAPRVRRWRYRETIHYVRAIDRSYDRLRPREAAPAP